MYQANSDFQRENMASSWKKCRSYGQITSHRLSLSSSISFFFLPKNESIETCLLEEGTCDPFNLLFFRTTGRHGDDECDPRFSALVGAGVRSFGEESDTVKSGFTNGVFLISFRFLSVL
mmetsp:Transcript_3082/g.6428  ORF Transcript_3082/g.6428 Transcript_3082/m.6428 type:complete len:119 (-) Transcript_3082:222-578(-)